MTTARTYAVRLAAARAVLADELDRRPTDAEVEAACEDLYGAPPPEAIRRLAKGVRVPMAEVLDEANRTRAGRSRRRGRSGATSASTPTTAELERRVDALEAASPKTPMPNRSHMPNPCADAPYNDDEDGDLDAAIAKLRKVLDDPDATDDEKERARRALAALDDEDTDDEEANALAYSRGKTRHHPAMSAHDRAIANFKKRYGYR